MSDEIKKFWLVIILNLTLLVVQIKWNKNVLGSYNACLVTVTSSIIHDEVIGGQKWLEMLREKNCTEKVAVP